jgi:hypothetical protein
MQSRYYIETLSDNTDIKITMFAIFPIILYRVGGTCRVYRLHHSFVYNPLLPTPLLSITIIPYTQFGPPDILCRGSLLRSCLH